MVDRLACGLRGPADRAPRADVESGPGRDQGPDGACGREQDEAGGGAGPRGYREARGGEPRGVVAGSDGEGRGP